MWESHDCKGLWCGYFVTEEDIQIGECPKEYAKECSFEYKLNSTVSSLPDTTTEYGEACGEVSRTLLTKTCEDCTTYVNKWREEYDEISSGPTCSTPTDDSKDSSSSGLAIAFAALVATLFF